jgi:hypothetical protein
MIIGKRAKIKDHAPGYVKALWNKKGTIELLPGRYVLRFDYPVDVGGSIFMEVVTLNDSAYELIESEQKK